MRMSLACHECLLTDCVDADYSTHLRTVADHSDGPIYMLSLTRFRPGCGQLFGRRNAGQDPDSQYIPIPLLSAVEASLCFVADVVAGAGGWNRIGVIRYPTRRAFLELGDRSDTKEWNARKEERAERMIMLGLVPTSSLPVEHSQRGLLEVWHGPAPGRLLRERQVEFEVEGTFLGDGRQWTGARYTAIDPGTALPLDPG